MIKSKTKVYHLGIVNHLDINNHNMYKSITIGYIKYYDRPQSHTCKLFWDQYECILIIPCAKFK